MTAKGGLSAEKYLGITGTTRPTATRDLQDLVSKRALTRTGERKHTRYYPNLSSKYRMRSLHEPKPLNG
ncbi:MAG: hypothetical protein HOP23_18845 [Methylococcaceae bacterium]|nr:hypothetical protein [Methylococcaceae bacterium]